MARLTARANDLAALPLFEGVPAEDLAALAEMLEPVEMPRGEVLLREGEPARSFLVIVSGEVEVHHFDDAGQPAVTSVPAGFIVGEMALLRGTRRSATVVASRDVFGYAGQRDALHRLLEIEGIAEELVRTARQRVAARVKPIAIHARDGTELTIRPVLPGDSRRVVEDRFSPQTLYKRFLSVRAPTEALLRYLVEVDYVDHFVWVVTDATDGSVIADARFVRDHDSPTVAEIAFTVADAQQGCGIGTLLLGALSMAARVDGIEMFQATVLSDNLPARAILERVGAEWERDEPGVVTTTFPVPGYDDLPERLGEYRQIADVAREVIWAFY